MQWDQQQQQMTNQTDWSPAQYWQCRGCDFWNWHTNKSCGKCKGQKQFMCAARTPNSSPSQEPKQAWNKYGHGNGGGGKSGQDGKAGGKGGGKSPHTDDNQASYPQNTAQPTAPKTKMEELTELLTRATAGLEEDQAFHSRSTVTGMSAPATDAIVDKKAMGAKIASLEAALAAVPTDMADTRQHITDQIAKLKSEIVEAKPIGIRIENCRGALARGNARLETARQAHMLTAQAVTAAQEFVQARDVELRAMELEMVQLVTHANQAPDSDLNSLQKMRAAMGQILTEMQSGAACSPQDTDNKNCGV